jgi:hypothetical protein
MKDFIKTQAAAETEVDDQPSMIPCHDMQEYVKNSGKTFFVETHGC